MRIEEGEEEVEGIGDAVGEATEDEDGDTEEEGEHLTLAGELDGGGHDETATDSKKETGPRTFRQTTGEDLGGWLDAVGLGIGNEPCGEETAYDVTQEDDSEHGPVALETDETCCARIELQTVIHNGGESEGEEDGTCHASYTEIDHTTNGNTNSCENGKRESHIFFN